MATATLYTACVLGAVGLYLLVRGVRSRANGGARSVGARVGARALPAVGAVLGLAAIGAIIGQAGDAVGAGQPGPLMAIFAILAIACATRMVTHHKPVYSALYFVLVVISSAGLFLMQEAEFIAFALVIVYAGAILITYMFVLMLAQQSPDPDDPHGLSEYDLHPREPAAGVVVGFILLALLSGAAVDGARALPASPSALQARLDAWDALRRMPGRVEDMIARTTDVESPLATTVDDLARLDVAPDGLTATAYHRIGSTPHAVTLSADALPDNTQRVGLALILDFPVSLELAGIILLMAMLGAVILARRQIELGEDETREAAGMPRLGHHDEPTGPGSAAPARPGGTGA